MSSSASVFSFLFIEHVSDSFFVARPRPRVFYLRNCTDGKKFPKQVLILAFFRRVWLFCLLHNL